MSEGISLAELQLAARNHGMPLEALQHDITPVGLHYLLIHYDIPFVDADTWTLDVDGAVERPLSLSLADLRARPSVEVAVTMECAGNGRALLEPHVVSQPWLRDAVGTARWRGVRVRDVLDDAGLSDGAVEVVFTALDRGVEGEVAQQYARSLSLADACDDDVILAYEMNGQPLLPQHGFPVRLVVPGWYGMTNVKWLSRIAVLQHPFDGYQQARAYRFRMNEDDAGVAVTRMAPRSLLVPPGIPEFLTRARALAPGPCLLQGRAWSGRGTIESVDVSTDGGETWSAGRLDGDELGRWAWRRWRYEWNAEPGRYRVGSRARDSAGNEQPSEALWNVGGYANNAVQWVDVEVA